MPQRPVEERREQSFTFLLALTFPKHSHRGHAKCETIHFHQKKTEVDGQKKTPKE